MLDDGIIPLPFSPSGTSQTQDKKGSGTLCRTLWRKVYNVVVGNPYFQHKYISTIISTLGVVLSRRKNNFDTWLGRYFPQSNLLAKAEWSQGPNVK